jgi:hypothetical protein
MPIRDRCPTWCAGCDRSRAPMRIRRAPPAAGVVAIGAFVVCAIATEAFGLAAARATRPPAASGAATGRVGSAGAVVDSRGHRAPAGAAAVHPGVVTDTRNASPIRPASWATPGRIRST